MVSLESHEASSALKLLGTCRNPALARIEAKLLSRSRVNDCLQDYLLGGKEVLMWELSSEDLQRKGLE